MGFSVVSITSADSLTAGLDSLLRWNAAGYAAGMEYMTRRPHLHANPAELVPHTASVITLAVNYYQPSLPFEHCNRYGRVARYAWGLDYHDVIKPRLLKLADQIRDMTSIDPAGDFHARGFVDAVPLLERALAERAGLGFFGKNTNILQPRAGSWFFLAELLVNVELPPEGERPAVSCGSCTKCLNACPTAAFPSPYVLDSNKCISYLTIENKGPIPELLREGIGEWIFGCDVCQEVCPFNRFSSPTEWPELHSEAGVGQTVDLVEVLTLRDDREFRARFAGTPLLRPKRRGLLRNAAVVAANVGCTTATPLLEQLASEDIEPLIRAHSLYALSRLDRGRALAAAARALRVDMNPLVLDEARAVLEKN